MTKPSVHKILPSQEIDQDDQLFDRLAPSKPNNNRMTEFRANSFAVVVDGKVARSHNGQLEIYFSKAAAKKVASELIANLVG